MQMLVGLDDFGQNEFSLMVMCVKKQELLQIRVIALCSLLVLLSEEFWTFPSPLRQKKNGGLYTEKFVSIFCYKFVDGVLQCINRIYSCNIMYNRLHFIRRHLQQTNAIELQTHEVTQCVFAESLRPCPIGRRSAIPQPRRSTQPLHAFLIHLKRGKKSHASGCVSFFFSFFPKNLSSFYRGNGNR